MPDYSIKPIEFQQIHANDLSPRLVRWIELITIGIQAINELIELYNNASLTSEKIDLFNAIENKWQHLEDRLPDSVVQNLPWYRQVMHEAFFINLQKVRCELEFPPSYQKASNNSAISLRASKFLECLSSSQVSQLLSILLGGQRATLSDLSRLYDANDPHFKEFESFFAEHTIEYKDGTNSKVFVVRNNLTKQRCILKVENRLSATKEVERVLRNKLNKDSPEDNFLVRTYAERKGTCTINGRVMTRTLLVMDYCEGMSWIRLASVPSHASQRLDLAIDVGIAQLKLAKMTREMGAVNTDYKGDNLFFIYNPPDELKIMVADGKGYCACNEEGYLLLPWDSRLVKTTNISAPEVINLPRDVPTIQVDAVHLYTIAKNIYEFLVANHMNKVLQSRMSQGFSAELFVADIFTTEKGIVLKNLLMKLGEIAPDKRISLNEALKILQTLKYGELYVNTWDVFQRDFREVTDTLINRWIHSLYQWRQNGVDAETRICEQYNIVMSALVKLKHISEVKFGQNDLISHDFVQESIWRLLTEKNHEQTLRDIDAVLDVQNSPETQDIFKTIARLRNPQSFNYLPSETREEKVSLLESSMSQIALLERGKIHMNTGQFESPKAVIRKALLRRPVLFIDKAQNDEMQMLSDELAMKIQCRRTKGLPNI